MISYSHWGMFPAQPVNANAVNNFHAAIQMNHLTSQANAINKMYDNCEQAHVSALFGWYGRPA